MDGRLLNSGEYSRFANFLNSDALNHGNDVSDMGDSNRLVATLNHTTLLPFLFFDSLW